MHALQCQHRMAALQVETLSTYIEFYDDRQMLHQRAVEGLKLEIAYLLENGEHGDVGLAGSCGSAHEDVFAGIQRCLADTALDSVELLHALKGWVHPLRQLADLNEPLALLECGWLTGWHQNLLIFLHSARSSSDHHCISAVFMPAIVCCKTPPSHLTCWLTGVLTLLEEAKLTPSLNTGFIQCCTLASFTGVQC